jgi:hypothetical protein
MRNFLNDVLLCRTNLSAQFSAEQAVKAGLADNAELEEVRFS